MIKFKSTEEAWAYGIKATPKQIKALQIARLRFIDQTNKLMDAGQFQKAWEPALQSQYESEALQAYEGKVR